MNTHIFHAANPSDKWVLAIDRDVAILCDDLDTILRLYNSVDDIENSPFGSMYMMSPGQVDHNIWGETARHSILEGRKIVNHDYISKRIARANRLYAGEDLLATTTIHQRRPFDLFAYFDPEG